MSMPVQSFDDEHEAFAASRVTQHVYVPTDDTFFAMLDQHADTVEADVKPPLVLLGNEGSGKSALLANWVAERSEHRHREEFLFQHFVGCTTPSLELAHTLFRLETALKKFFQLREMKVPDTEEELRWSLNRFLAAAAKKHSPRRIVIIIDGVNRLKSQDAPDGQLLWLPTELPPCVRFIVSSVEYERTLTKGSMDIPQHRTWVELARRQCPFLRIAPLDVNTRHKVIKEFLRLNVGVLDLADGQQFKIVTAPASSQPMYLRSLLQALRLSSSLTTATTDQLLETFLGCSSAHELIEKNLDICNQAVFSEVEGIRVVDGSREDILGKMFSIVYVSRNGLTEDEILGVLKMVAKFNPDEITAQKMFTILKEFTMVVHNMHSFSHEVYREVVYAKYICSNDALVRWHYLMSRFFDHLPPCARKLVALPYHLEKAGSWSKVKNCLTDIDMFQLWWSPKLSFKADFIKFWASLVKQSTTKKGRHGKRGGGDANGGGGGADSEQYTNRPTYDIVEEYVKSLDEYRNTKRPQPTDEDIADIVLQVGDFLIEFAMLGHEALADVPSLIHPMVPTQDLSALGVPFMQIGQDGKWELEVPRVLYKAIGGKTNSDENDTADGDAALKDGNDVSYTADGPPKAANDNQEPYTAYYFNRWMWIQYAFIALGNCSTKRFTDGLPKDDSTSDSLMKSSKQRSDDGGPQTSPGKDRKKGPASTVSSSAMSKSWSVESFKLPQIKFTRKATRTTRRITGATTGDDSVVDKVALRLQSLQDDIQCYREEHDFVVNMKNVLQRRLDDIKGMHTEMVKSSESLDLFDGALRQVEHREIEVAQRNEELRKLNDNLASVVMICERHPANVPALIQEFENKLQQDIFLITEIKKRLFAQRFEKQVTSTSFRQMKSLIDEGMKMHEELLNYRTEVKNVLQAQYKEDTRRFNTDRASTLNTKSRKSGKMQRSLEITNGSVEGHGVVSIEQSWEAIWATISLRTGITDPDIFFQRLNNSGTLAEQMTAMRKQSEAKVEALKKEQSSVEKELEDSRYNASVGGAYSNKDGQKKLVEKQLELRHIKERSESAQQLVQRVESGLVHIGEMLGVEPREEVTDLLKDIENALDTIMDEREKQQQQQTVQAGGTADGPSRTLVSFDKSAKSGNLFSDLYALNVPSRGTAKVHKKGPIMASPRTSKEGKLDDHNDDDNDDDNEEDGKLDRQYVKIQAERNARALQKKQQKHAKLEGFLGTV